MRQDKDSNKTTPERDNDEDEAMSPMKELAMDRKNRTDRTLSLPVGRGGTKTDKAAYQDDDYAEAINRLKKLESAKGKKPSRVKSGKAKKKGAGDRPDSRSEDVGPRHLGRNDRAASLPVKGPRRIESTVRANARHPDFESPGAARRMLSAVAEADSQRLLDEAPEKHEPRQIDKSNRALSMPMRGPRRIESTVRPNAAHPNISSPDKKKGKLSSAVKSLTPRSPRRIESTVRANSSHPDFDSPSREPRRISDEMRSGGDNEETERLKIVEQKKRLHRDEKDRLDEKNRTMSLPVGPRRIESTVRPNARHPEFSNVSEGLKETGDKRDAMFPTSPLGPRRVESTVRPNAHHPDFKSPAPQAHGEKPDGDAINGLSTKNRTVSMPARGPRRVESTVRPNARHPDFGNKNAPSTQEDEIGREAARRLRSLEEKKNPRTATSPATKERLTPGNRTTSLPASMPRRVESTVRPNESHPNFGEQNTNSKKTGRNRKEAAKDQPRERSGRSLFGRLRSLQPGKKKKKGLSFRRKEEQ